MFKIKKKNKIIEANKVHKIGSELDFSVAEAYNLLRTNLSFSFPGKEGGRTIGITSASPAEGKSYTAVNLSYSLAKDGKRVLLVDADLRKPSIAEKMHLKMVPGLSNLLVERDGSFIHENVLHENLSVLTSGDAPPNPSELIGSDEMQCHLKRFVAEYDYIIVDLPPIMEVPDPLVIAKNLDGMILVVKHEHTHKSDIKETVHKLQFANARILGFVYNGYTANYTRSYKKYSRYYAYKKRTK